MAQQNNEVCAQIPAGSPDVKYCCQFFRFLPSVWYWFWCVCLVRGPFWRSWGKLLLALGSRQNSFSQEALPEHTLVPRYPYRNLGALGLPATLLLWRFSWSSSSLKLLGVWQLHSDLLIPQHQTVSLVKWRSVLSKT